MWEAREHLRCFPMTTSHQETYTTNTLTAHSTQHTVQQSSCMGQERSTDFDKKECPSGTTPKPWNAANYVNNRLTSMMMIALEYMVTNRQFKYVGGLATRKDVYTALIYHIRSSTQATLQAAITLFQ